MTKKLFLRATAINACFDSIDYNNPHLEISGDGLDVVLDDTESNKFIDNPNGYKLPNTASPKFAKLEALLDQERKIVNLSVGDSFYKCLVGVSVFGGFRNKLKEFSQSINSYGSLEFQLIEDISTASTIASYLSFRNDAKTVGKLPNETTNAFVARLGDTCAGWIQSGTAIKAVQAGKPIPVKIGPLANSNFFSAGLSLHNTKVQAMRRRRYIALVVDDDKLIRTLAGFRDTSGEADQNENILHEYHTTIENNPDSLLITSIKAKPNTVPFEECLSASISVEKLRNSSLNLMTQNCRDLLNNSSGCLHLNDLLRAVGHFVNNLNFQIKSSSNKS